MREHNFFFGYANVDDASQTGFFDYKTVTAEDLRMYRGYLQANKEPKKTSQ